eukprot:SAG31_NODE_6221_length_2113_cov_13.879841_2_plen_60_part_01
MILTGCPWGQVGFTMQYRDATATAMLQVMMCEISAYCGNHTNRIETRSSRSVAGRSSSRR